MAALPTMTMKPVFEFSTRIQQELIRSTSDDDSVFHIISRKAFVFHHYLMKQIVLRPYFLKNVLVSNVFDCMLGCGSGDIITFDTYKQLEPFGPIISLPVMAIVTYILALIRFSYDGIWSKLFQALITIRYMAQNGVRIKDLFMVRTIDYDKSGCSVVFCIEEKCVQCHKPYLQTLLSSTRICICVCESCQRKSEECPKCQSSPCTGIYILKNWP